VIFPNIGPQYYDEKHKGLLSRMEAFYASSITVNQAFWSEADQDTRFEVGDQTLWNDLYGNLPAVSRRQFNFNHIRPVVSMIGGHQRRNRKSTIVVPVENADQDTADQFTKVLLNIHKQEGVLETISDAFHGALVTGMNLLQLWIDYREDPVSGNIKVDNCAYNSFLIDPFFRKADLSDCNGIWKRSFLTRRECISLMPDHEEEILGLIGNESGTGRDGKFQFMPESYGYAYKNLLTYDEFYYRDYRKQKLLVDTKTGETLEWKSDDKERLDEYLAAYPEVTVIESDIPTVKVAIVVQGKVLFDGPNPLGIDSWPFIPVFTYYNPQSPYFQYRIQGVVRNLRDAQYLYNRRKVIELDILESQVTSGWKYKEGSVVNVKDLYSLAGQGRSIAIKSTANLADAEQIMAPSIPPSMMQVSEALGNEIMKISGVNEELLGAAVDDKAGILSMLRQGAGLTTLQGLFDNLDRAQKLLGNVMIEAIQANYTPGKIQKILEGQQPSQQFYNKAFGKYHASVEDGINTSTQKQMQFAQLLHLREAGIPIPDSALLEASTLQNKNQLIEQIEQQQQQQQQMQQQQMQAQIEELKAKIELSHARAEADRGLGLERVSRVQENQALAIERRAQAHKDDDTAFLNKIKALKELEGMDLDHLQRLINLGHSLQAQQDVENRQEDMQVSSDVKSDLSSLLKPQQSQEPERLTQ
jgi:Phage P22-like portal protein